MVLPYVQAFETGIDDLERSCMHHYRDSFLQVSPLSSGSSEYACLSYIDKLVCGHIRIRVYLTKQVWQSHFCAIILDI
jgi:hypothetical protein